MVSSFAFFSAPSSVFTEPSDASCSRATMASLRASTVPAPMNGSTTSA